MLLLLDLDNTLIDRAAAFRRWAVAFAATIGAPAGAADWLIAADRDGLEPRERVAAAIRQRFGLTGRGQADVVADLRRGLVENFELDPAVPEALDRARSAGWVPVVVTNGTVHQQELKLTHTGLAGHVAGWVISEGAGVRKPDPVIFKLAADSVSESLDGAWMIGDSAEADIGGAHAAGIASIWLHRQRAWSLTEFAPTRIADTCCEGIMSLVDRPAESDPRLSRRRGARRPLPDGRGGRSARPDGRLLRGPARRRERCGDPARAATRRSSARRCLGHQGAWGLPEPRGPVDRLGRGPGGMPSASGRDDGSGGVTHGSGLP